MTRIHITASGKAARCNASERQCPRGGSDQHFDSMKEAVLALAKREAKKKSAGQTYDEAIRETDAEVQTVPATPQEQARWIIEGLERVPFEDRAARIITFAQGKYTTVDELVALRAELYGYNDRLADELDACVPEAKFGAYRNGWVEHQLATKSLNDDSTPYTQQEVNDLAFEELRKAGLLSEGWTIAHGHQVNALATTFYGTKQIQFSKLWTPVLTRAEMRDTITHEVAHAKVGSAHGHDETWQAAHREMGGSGEEKHHSEEVQQKIAYRERFKKFYPEGLKGGTRGGVGKKELDPAMIEALKLKYLKKFKVPFDESGLSVPELLQMAQKGELD